MWLIRVRRDGFIPNEHSSLCSDHFTDDCFEYQNFTNRKQLKPGSVPSLFSYTVRKTRSEKQRIVSASTNSIPASSKNSNLRLAAQTPKIGNVQSLAKDNCTPLVPGQRTSKATDAPADPHLEPEVVIKEEPVDYDEPSGSQTYTTGAPLKVEFILPHDEGEWPSRDAPSTSKSGPSTSKDTPITSVLEFSVENEPELNVATYVDQIVAAAKPPRKKKGTPKTDVVAGISEKRHRENEAGESEVVLSKDSNLSTSEPQKPKDEFDAFGEYIAMELRQMDWKTRAFLQKAIGDLVFDAKMGKFKDKSSSEEAVPN